MKLITTLVKATLSFHFHFVVALLRAPFVLLGLIFKP